MHSQEKLFVGIDIGTSSVRCCAIDVNKSIIANSKTSLPPPQNPAPGHYEQEAGLWWQAVESALVQLLEKIDRKQVASIAIDGTSSTVLLVDQNNTPKTIALMYNDARSQAILDIVKAHVPADNITASASSSLSKALWLSRQLPDSNAENTFVTHQADWIAAKFLGKAGISDPNNCLKLGYDSCNNQWPEWISFLAVSLPVVTATGCSFGLIHSDMASHFGLSGHVKIIAGTTDSTASSLATGITTAGQAVTTIGSTLTMKIVTDKAITSTKDGIYSHKLPNGLWLAGGASNSGGKVLLKHFDTDTIERLSRQIDTSVNTGLDFYPLTEPGERFPFNDPSMQPRLQPRPQSDIEFLQGIFEGFAKIEKLAYEKLTALGACKPSLVITAGGQAASNESLSAIRQNILGLTVQKAHQTEASYGVALIAGNFI